MGFLDNSTVTVDAILTRRGRQILSQGGNFAISKFALSDEEVDYTLYDVTHPNGTDSYGSVIENMNLLEAVPNRAGFNSFLVNQSLAGAKLQIDSLTYSNVEQQTPISIAPATVGGPEETYTFSISNLNIITIKNNKVSETYSKLSNSHQIGKVMYTDYFFIFQISGCILLVAMIGAIVLTFRKRVGVKTQSYLKQISRERSEGVETLSIENNKGVNVDD